MHGYVERAPLPALAADVRTVWIQHAGTANYVQRHLPTGGAEIHWRHWRTGAAPRLLGPLTVPRTEVIPAGTTVVGVRFWPGGVPLATPDRSVLTVGLEQFVDRQVDLDVLWGTDVLRLAEQARADDAEHALARLQAYVMRMLAAGGVDAQIRVAVRSLMPRLPGGPSRGTGPAPRVGPAAPPSVGSVAEQVGLSVSQLRRRCSRSVGHSPKVLQRTLRFQGFLALAQAALDASATDNARPLAEVGYAELAARLGYADQAHLSRECVRLSGRTPTDLFGADVHRCADGHEHGASYRPFLAAAPGGALAR